ncbi:hypothetical protein ACFLYM_00475 [Chloroflexota bacterium]
MIAPNRIKPSARKLIPLIIVLLSLLTIGLPAPAQAGLMQWSVVDTPSGTSNVIVSPSEVNSIAVAADGITCYAVDVAHGRVYRSRDGGLQWDDITASLTAAGAAMPACDVVIAPDNPGFVAVVASTGGLPRSVFITSDGGNQWYNTNCTVVNNIGAIDISPNYGSYDIVVGTRTGGGGGGVSIFRTPGPGTWADQGITGDIAAAVFSPTYAADRSLVIAYANATGTYVDIGVHDTTTNTTTWGIIGPLEITAAGAGTSPKANQILTADIELPIDFSGQIAGLRRIYISTNDAGASGNAGIYRVDDNIVYKIMPPGGPGMISSIAYYGTHNSGKLLAGEVKANASLATVDIWYCSNPGETCPLSACLLWQRAAKPPTGGAGTGNANAQVAWSPNGVRAYCGTSSANLDVAGWPMGYLTAQALDESAFSHTIDGGNTWNQTGLIDTRIDFLSDVASSINSDVLYLASINTNGGLNGFDSLWRSTTYPAGRAWERILCVLVTSNNSLVRLGPGQSLEHVFLAGTATNELYQSTDMGQIWNKVLPGVNITDFTLIQTVGGLNMFILDNNFVRSGQYAGGIWQWRAKTNTSLNSGHTIDVLEPGIVAVGDAGTGEVAYSPDGDLQFIKLPPLPNPGNVHVAIDPRSGPVIAIYAASDAAAGKVNRWVTGQSPNWIDLGAPGQSYYGLASAGTLYCAWTLGGTNAVDRSLNPDVYLPSEIWWDTMNAGLAAGVVFTSEPVSIKWSYGINLWAIDNRPYTANTGLLWNYTDGLAPSPRPINPEQQALLHQPPIPVSPEMDTTIPANTNTGRIADIEFIWKHPTTAVGYELWIAEDSEFSDIVLKQSVTPRIPAAPVWTLSGDKSPLETGKTYYWKVRVNRDAAYERVNGQWSQTMNFAVEYVDIPEVVHPVPDLISPADNEVIRDQSPQFSWTEVPGATRYKIILAEDEALTDTITDKNVSTATYRYTARLDAENTYYWQVQVIEPFQGQPSPIFEFIVSFKEEATTPSQTLDIDYTGIGLWITIGILAILLIIAVVIIILLRRTR